VIYRTYYQIFGYNAWGTMWRVVTVIAVGYEMTGIVVFVIGYIVASDMGNWNYITHRLLTDLMWEALFIAFALLISHLINKRQAARKKEVSPLGE